MTVRLLVISSDTYPPTRVDVSILFGAELAGRGHHIDWILQSEAECARSYATQWGGGTAWVGATDLGHSLFRRLRKHALGIANDLRLFSRLRRGNYDAVEVKDKFLAGLLAILARRLFGVRFIYWLSFPFPEYYLLRAKDGTARYPFLYLMRGLAFKWLLYRCLLPAADHVFVQSEQMRTDIAAAGIAPEKMTAVPMGIRVEMFAPADPQEARRVLPPGIPAVLYLGTLDKVRRLDFVIRAFSMVRAKVPEARLYIVGRGEDAGDEALLRDEVARLGLQSSVELVGQLPQPEALRYVQEADVCVSPYYPTPVLRSTSPTKLIEYMAMAKAVVANDHPEQRRVLEDSGAGYCVAYEEGAMAAAIVSLLENPETARVMGQRGRRYAIERRDYGVIADLVERRLLAVVASGARAA
ncbi:MAG TPA: glycosyltransferase family 4 protein [Steroidobacteraceae bacterium]|jgi:glycosyltransferase involved in cell wall biosynthesis|nr:glycosyltransferase family 4 protein [Steroidobacteraceae bacterium]